MATVATTHFADRLAEAVERKRSQLVVGLDPRPDHLPVELRGEAHHGREEAAAACERFCRGLVDAVAPYVVAVKPQIAFFEALGSDGIRAFEEVCAYSRAAGLQVIADAKRGDIGSTARAYVTAFLEGEPPLADAVTVNPYLGRDAVEPFLAACRRSGAGIFCVVKTSNAGGAEVQDLALTDGRERISSGSTACPPSAPSSARRIHARSARRGVCCRARSSSSPASARRERRPPTWRAHSRAVPRARSSTCPAT